MKTTRTRKTMKTTRTTKTMKAMDGTLNQPVHRNSITNVKYREEHNHKNTTQIETQHNTMLLAMIQATTNRR
jgi:hypothetical protein